MQYIVHRYPSVCVKVTGIEANNVKEAIQKAKLSMNLHHVLDNHTPSSANVASIEWDEGPDNSFFVDPLDSKGAVIHHQSTWVDGLSLEPLINCKTVVERKAEANDACKRFMEELLASCETLTGIAEVHGMRTLADLMYLQGAILHDGFIDHYPEESDVLDIIKGLPSGQKWEKFIQVQEQDVRSEESRTAISLTK